MKDFGVYLVAFIVSVSIHASMFSEDKFLYYKAGTVNKPTTEAKISFRKRKVKQVPEIPKPKPKPKKKKKRTVSKPKPIVVPVQEPEPEEVAEVDTERAEMERRHYLSVVMDCIEKCKYYPKAARRRGVNGEIMVNFTLMPNGEVKDVEANGGHKMLCMAAKEAVLKASPLPAPPGGEAYPVKFVMEYALK